MRIDTKALESFRADSTRTLYIFDVRDPTDYAAGHFPGAVNAPGGQLVQATDQYAATLGARLVLIDDREVRAVMTASWLKQMGWRDVFVLAASGSEKGRPPVPLLGPAPPAERAIEAKELSDLVAHNRVTVVDLSLSPAYRKGHIPGAWFAIRTRLTEALAKVPMNGQLILTSEDGVLAGLVRTAHGRRAARLLAQAVRADRWRQRRQGCHERIPVLGGRSAAADRARWHHAVHHAGVSLRRRLRK
jgi:rhodanese-related sulfurtransferase